ncbi:structural maintenance of chromosomes protein 6 [Elysia marginata]|uniref:Structural maintenance of chromosomes protein 6 n=1 Tax=Elysia marginata TaxID=1093978 RepID=A0AAV4H4N6_9GAST|nr:structural maintenance of chromosomes protein 6 [Elysia marginata]
MTRIMMKRDSSEPGIAPRHKRRKTNLGSGDSDFSEDETEQVSTQSQSLVESSLVEATLLSQKEDPMPGVIRKIALHNFMCHNHLDVKLGPHVNFIVGRNGSGKSAVITALVVGLGGKAGITGRGRAIKNFIKTGKRDAWVEICLNNKGKDSYKHHLYGDKIFIKRKFSIDGGSSYSVHSESGQHISARRDELMHITDHFNIQVDNPVSILNQDTSRNFLNSKSAGDKFKFFMRATQLEQMNQDYSDVHRHMQCTKQDIDCKKETLETMRKEVKVWQSKFKNLAALSELKIKVTKLKNEMAWALVAERERGMKPLEKSLKSEEVALPQYVKKVDQTKKHQEEWEARLKDLEQRVMECSKAVRDLQPLLEARHKDVALAKQALAPILNQLKAIDRELRSARAECKQCEERIDELRSIASRDYDADRRKREDQIARLEKNLEEAVSKQRVSEHEITQYASNVARGRTEMAAIDNQLKAKSNKQREVRMSLQTLRAAKNDRLQRFGAWVPTVISQINAQKRQFHKIPLGPLGAKFELKDSKWALAMESCLKGLVSSFVCHDHHDAKLLEDIFNRHCPRGRRPAIITSAFSSKMHDVSEHRVRSRDFPCVLDVIKCKDPVVINTLIDQRSIENVLLIEDANEARTVMMRNPPHNAKECFTIEGDQAFCRPTFRYYSSDKTTVRFLMADVQAQIDLLQLEDGRIQDEVDELMQQKTAKQAEVTKNHQLEKSCQTQINRAKENMSRLKFEIKELQSVEDPAPIDVTTLEEEVNDYNKKIEDLQNQRHSILQDKTQGETKLNEAKSNLEQVETEIREKSDDGIPLQEEIRQTQTDLETARNSRKHYVGKLKEQERKIQELKRQLESYKRDVETDRNKALQICEPIATQRLPDNIENEIHQIQHRITEEEKEQGNEQEITDTFKNKKDTFERVKREMQQLHNFLDKLEEVMQKRQIAYMKMRKSIANRTKYYFLMQMHHRSFTGKMNFDFNEETLDILVNPGKDLSGSVAKSKGRNESSKDALEGCDLRSLSGGERSFSTVCFILSLWEAMESPFRCLDEFDVFMDMVNRSISMDMMIEAANAHHNMQFVFLKPQDMSSVRKIHNCKIFRMPDPERDDRQRTLAFSQQGTQ